MSTTGLRQIQGLFGGAEGGRRDLRRGHIDVDDEDDEESVRGWIDVEVVEEMAMSLEQARMGVETELENELDAIEEQLALETLAEQVS